MDFRYNSNINNDKKAILVMRVILVEVGNFLKKSQEVITSYLHNNHIFLYLQFILFLGNP